MKKEILVALAGNPNSGKTSLFNSIVGANLRVGNYPGVTIEKTEGVLTAVHPEFRYTVPPSLNEALLPYAGKEAVLGVRPENFVVSPIEKTPGPEKKASWICDRVIDFSEPQGSYSILITHIGGTEVKIVSSEFLELQANTKVSLSVKEAMFFDPVTGIRIGA
jgi:ribosome-interacting GTPase 1